MEWPEMPEVEVLYQGYHMIDDEWQKVVIVCYSYRKKENEDEDKKDK